MADTLPLKEIEFLSDLAEYARGRGGEKYDFGSNDNCACAQFLRDTGRAEIPSVGGFGWDDLAKDESGETHLLPWDDDGPLVEYPHTFSALAERIEALIPARVERVG